MEQETESNMSDFNRKRRGPRYTIKVTNGDTGAIFIHRNLSKREVDWIDLDPNLTVEVLRK